MINTFRASAIIVFLLITKPLSAQEFGPPPPACDSFFTIDPDGDGITEFDLTFYVDQIVRPKQLADFGTDLSGYTLNMYASDAAFFLGDPPITGLYPNQFDGQQCYLDYVYTGGGPEYAIGSFEWSNFAHCHSLNAIAANGDYDGDGVLNSLEDLNGNLVLNDDDTDSDNSFNFFDTDDDADGQPTIEEDYNFNGDWLDDDLNSNGIPDYLDPEVSAPLPVKKFNGAAFSLYPNPANGSLNIAGAEGSAVIYNIDGKKVAEFPDVSKPLDISGLDAGLYMIKVSDGEKEKTLKFSVK